MTVESDMLDAPDIYHARAGVYVHGAGLYAHGAEIFVHGVGQAARLHPTDR